MAGPKKDVLIFFFKVYSVLKQKIFRTYILDEAYEIGCKNGNLEKIRHLIVEICDFENDCNKSINQNINLNQHTCLNLRDVNIYDSQLVTSYLMQLTSFRRALLLASYNNSKVIFPLKKSWQNILNNNGYKTSKLFCTLLWFAFRAIYLLRSTSKLLEIISHAGENKKNSLNSNKHAIYFNDLAEQNIPRIGTIEIPKTFISWLIRENLIEKNIEIYHSNRKIRNEKDFFQNSYIYLNNATNLSSNVNRREIIGKLLTIFGFWSKDPLKRIKVLLNIPDILEGMVVNSNLHRIKIESIIVHSSNPSLKPLWILVLERNNINVEYFFYAIYTEIKHISGNPPEDGLWRLAKWNKYNLIDEFQKDEIYQKTNFREAEFRVVGPPWWADQAIKYIPPEEKHLILFDSYSAEGSYGLNTLNEYEWNLDSTAISYLEDVLELAQEFRIKVVHKMKRPANNFTSNIYLAKLAQLKEKYSNVYLFSVDAVAPDTAIEFSCGVICKPVSTVGIVARNLGKKVAAYNPGSTIDSDDPGLRGVGLCQSKSELRNFISTL